MKNPLIHPSKLHPITGLPLVAVGLGKRGPIWPVIGAAEGDPEPIPEPDKTLTQADVDRIVADRVAREKNKYADYGDLKAKAAKLDEIEAATASDLEKAVKAARDEATAAERARTAGVLAASEARALAADRFENPSTAVRLLDLKDVSVSEDGVVDAEGVKSLLDALATSDPYLLKKEASPVPTPGQAGIGVTGGTVVRDPRAADMAQIEADLAATKRR